jgi:hypothetical protein
MDADTFVEMLLAILIIGIPGAALASRLVLRPMLRDVVEAIRSVKQPEASEIERRFAELEEGQKALERKLGQVIETDRFDRELLESRGPEGDRTA